MGIIARFTRSSMLEVIRSDYIVTARAKGLAEGPVILKHVLKNGFIPVVTLLGPMFAAVGTGSFFVESIFRVPGMGRFFVLSMTGRDYPMIMAVVLALRRVPRPHEPRGRSPLWLSRPPHPILASTPRTSLAAAPSAAEARASGATRGAGCCATSSRWWAASVVILLCLVAIFADVIAPQSYTKANFGHLYELPIAGVPARHRPARARRALAPDLRRARLHAGGARAPR